MKKGYKFLKPRPKEVREKISKGCKESYTQERKDANSVRMKKLWAIIKENNTN